MNNTGNDNSILMTSSILQKIMLVAILLQNPACGNRVGNPDKFTDVDENKKVKSVNLEFIAVNSSDATQADFNIKIIKFLKEGSILEEYVINKVVSTSGDSSIIEVQFKRSDFDTVRYVLNDSGNVIYIGGKAKNINLTSEFDISYTYDKTKDRTSVILFDLGILYSEFVNSVDGEITLPLAMIDSNLHASLESSYDGYDKICIYPSDAAATTNSSCSDALRMAEKPDSPIEYITYGKYAVYKFNAGTLVAIEDLEINENKTYSLAKVEKPSVDPEEITPTVDPEEITTPEEVETLNLGPDLVTNSDFTNGANPWIAFTNSDSSIPKVVMEIVANPIDTSLGNSAKFVVPVDTPSTAQFYHSSIDLEPSQEYLLSFTACADKDSELSVSVIKHTSPFGTYGLNAEPISLNDQCQNKNIRFTSKAAGSTLENGRLVFWLSRLTDSGTYYLDNIKLQKIISE